MGDADVGRVIRGEDGQWYWHIVAANNEKIAAGGEGFTRDEDAVRAGKRVRPDIEWEVEDGTETR